MWAQPGVRAGGRQRSSRPRSCWPGGPCTMGGSDPLPDCPPEFSEKLGRTGGMRERRLGPGGGDTSRGGPGCRRHGRQNALPQTCCWAEGCFELVVLGKQRLQEKFCKQRRQPFVRDTCPHGGGGNRSQGGVVCREPVLSSWPLPTPTPLSIAAAGVSAGGSGHIREFVRGCAGGTAGGLSVFPSRHGGISRELGGVEGKLVVVPAVGGGI